MKLLFTYILVLVSTVVFSQNLDSLTFSYINQYRVKNGKKVLTWSEDIHKRCVKQSNDMISNDSMYHSHILTEAENVAYAKLSSLPESNDYKVFIKKYFNLNYNDIVDNVEVYVSTTTVYVWAKSYRHNKNMLSNGDKASVSVIVGGFKKNNNKVFNREVVKGFGDYYITVSPHSATFRIN